MHIHGLRSWGIKASLKLHAIRQQFFQKEEIVPICEHLSGVQSVLICLPTEKEGVEAVMNSVQEFRQIFPKAHITLLNSAENSLQDYIFNDFSLVEYQETSLSRWGLLEKSFRALLFKQPVGIIIDLSKAFHILNTLVVCSSRAKLRIGFNHPERNSFYNFVIRLEPNQDWERSLAILYRYLSLGTPVYA